MKYEFKGTKGEWVITDNENPDERWIYTENGEVGDIVCCPPDYDAEASLKLWGANSRLIIAAPELLQACIMALQTVSDNGHTDGGTAETLRAAIHKALNIN